MVIFHSYVGLPTGRGVVPSSPGPMEHIRILLLGVSFRVYISYKIRTRQKSEKD